MLQKCRKREVFLSLLVLLGAPIAARGDEKLDLIELRVEPAAEASPALRYRLLPPPLDLSPLNAALLYNKAMLLHAQLEPGGEVEEKIVEWLETPPGKLPRDEVRSAVPYDHVLHLTDMAARRKRCEWDPPLREEENVFAILLPELSEARDIGRLVALKARLEIAEGKPEEALRTLQTGLAMSRHIADQPIVVSALVGIATADTMTDQVVAWIEMPGSKNLYWALTALPDPLIDMGKALELESAWLLMLFPEWSELRKRTLTEAEANRLLLEALTKIRELGALSGPAEGGLAEELGQLGAAGYVLLQVPRAKAELKEMGFSKGRLESMPPAQIALVHGVEVYERARDEMFKWFEVPYWQAHRGLKGVEADLDELRQREIVPLASLLLPALGQANFRQAQLDRRIAALRCVEAVRAHAAAHDGKLPASLEEIDGLPIPGNPVTGKPFGYRLEGQTAVLNAESLGDHPAEQYRIRLVPAKGKKP